MEKLTTKRCINWHRYDGIVRYVPDSLVLVPVPNWQIVFTVGLKIKAEVGSVKNIFITYDPEPREKLTLTQRDSRDGGGAK